MKSIFRTFLIVVFSSLMGVFLLLCPEVSAFHCGDGLVSIGDTKSRVLIECGKPTHKEKVGAKDIYYNDQRQKKRKKSSKTVEQWAYNCGENDFIYILTFEGGKLIKEETNGRGKGKSQCGGH
jgi:hypothetical protein